MSKLLSQLVGVPEQLLGLQIKQLESASGAPGIDVRLTAEIIAKVHLHVKALGLDPVDTTGEELYGALLSLIGLHDQFLVRRIGGSNSGDVADLLPRIKRFSETINIPRTAWLLKHSVAKRLLKATPPKKVMKALGYRSVDSMLKRESVDELFAGIVLLESKEWQSSFHQKYKKLQPSDFETRGISTLLLDGVKWGHAAATYVNQSGENIMHIKELGVIILFPMPVVHLEGLTIVLLPLILHSINEIRTYSTYFRMKQTRVDFGQIIVDTLSKDLGRHATMAGQHIHWRVVHRYYGSVTEANHPDFLEPHIQPDDLFWRKAEAILYKIEPALHFWHDMDYVGSTKQGVSISFNLIDMAVSYINKLPYGQHSVAHLQTGVWGELSARYLDTEALRQQVIGQLDDPSHGDVFSGERADYV